VTPLPEPACEVFYREGRIGWVMPMEPGMHCLALEIPAEQFPRFRAEAAESFAAEFGALHGMAGRLAGATRVGPVHGTRGVENYLRVPHGPGWALTGDAACCKDPSTGLGIEDAFRQAFLLEEALGAALDGADWEAAMTEYHRRRDEALTPGYRATLAYTRAPETPAESVAWLRGVLANAGLARLLGAGFPAAARSAEVFPGPALATVARAARAFGAEEGHGEKRRAA